MAQLGKLSWVILTIYTDVNSVFILISGRWTVLENPIILKAVESNPSNSIILSKISCSPTQRKQNMETVVLCI